eukprot:CAMPEP_0172867736 /NCGR_PEP_ID=MMETSP1075-20121228/84436_1 /TAXON_ID=2916 /ORGANISM="Ceratium fusus, Strain PA161109" /LENGTH=42 /DNA_ID= /DNA_START= /DNA_END= /DNA_ORIENTATION=
MSNDPAELPAAPFLVVARPIVGCTGVVAAFIDCSGVVTAFGC